MLQLALILAIAALGVAVGTFFVVWQRGAFAAPIVTDPTVEMPIVLLFGNLNSSRKCADKEFRGTAELELLYLPSPNPRAEVRVTLEIRRSDNVSVALARTDLGIFRNDVTESVSFDGELTDPCDDGDFTMVATAVNQGPGSTTLIDSDRVFVDALDFVVSMPTQISTTDGIRFTLDVVIDCCGRGGRHRVSFSNRSGVRNLRAAPRRFRCGDANDQDTVTITGEKEDENQVGVFTVNARSAFGRCVLGSVQVE